MAIIYYNNDTEINLTDLINIVDDLTSSSSTSALSANQGKALNTIIGNLSSLTTTDKSSIVSAINDVVHKTDLLGSEPVGSILPYCGNEAPPGYYICDGRAISRENNADLFNVIGTTYGSGDGSTTFNLPDLRGRVVIGLDVNDTDFDTLGETGGEKTHTLTVDELAPHNHDVKVKMNASGFGDGYLTSASGYDYTTSNSPINSTGGGQAHNNLQPYIVINYIIKAEGTEPATMAESLPVGSVVDFDGEVNRIPTGWVVTENDSPEAIFCKLNNETTFTNQYVDITNWVKLSGVGSNLTISNGKILIGNGINYVKVTCKLWADVNANSLVYTHIRKNNSNVNGTWQIHYIIQGQAQSVFNQGIVDVQEGDVITISTYGNGSLNANTTIIVEKID